MTPPAVVCVSCGHTRRMHEPDGSACRVDGCDCDGFAAILPDDPGENEDEEPEEELDELDFNH